RRPVGQRSPGPRRRHPAVRPPLGRPLRWPGRVSTSHGNDQPWGKSKGENQRGKIKGDENQRGRKSKGKSKGTRLESRRGERGSGLGERPAAPRPGPHSACPCILSHQRPRRVSEAFGGLAKT